MEANATHEVSVKRKTMRKEEDFMPKMDCYTCKELYQMRESSKLGSLVAVDGAVTRGPIERGGTNGLHIIIQYN